MEIFERKQKQAEKRLTMGVGDNSANLLLQGGASGQQRYSAQISRSDLKGRGIETIEAR